MLNQLKNNENILPQLQIIVGSIMISFSAVFVRLTSMGPTVDGFYRMLFGGVILAAIAILNRQKLLGNRRAMLFVALAGLFFSLDLIFWHRAIDPIGPGMATIIVNLQVFILIFLGLVFYGDKVKKAFYIAIPLAAIGMYFLIGMRWGELSESYRIGIYQCLIAMLSYTCYIIALRKSQQVKNKIPVIANLALISLISAVILGVVGFAQKESFVITSWVNFSWLFLYGIFGQVLGWLLISYGLPKVRLSVAGFLLLLQPALSFVWDIWFFNRTTPMIQVAGVLITLLAIYISSISRVTTD